MFVNSVANNCSGYKPKRGDVNVMENNAFITENRSCENCTKFINGQCKESALFGLIVSADQNNMFF